MASTPDVSRMMRRHGIERIVFVPEQRLSDFTVPEEFHAWPFDSGHDAELAGRGATVEDAILDATLRARREAA